MGTPAFACPSLETLLARPDPVVGVVCQPDRPRGRGLSVTAPEVKRLAEAGGVPELQPERLRDPAFQSSLAQLAPDLIVVAAYGKLLPRAILDLPPRGCINVHASLLPRHRGAAPIAWAILAGDTVTGVTIMAMTEAMDAGDILLQQEETITATDTGGTLADRLAVLGGRLLDEAIEGLQAGTVRPVPQPSHGVTLAPRIEPVHCRIDWRRSADEIERLVRGLAPVPSAFTTLEGRVLKIHRAAVEPRAVAAPPGSIVAAGADGLVVATGRGGLALLEVQLEGRRRLPAAAFLAGRRLRPGAWLGGE